MLRAMIRAIIKREIHPGSRLELRTRCMEHQRMCSIVPYDVHDMH